jgi:hypothetical protein
MSTFLYSVISNRAFKMDWEHPTPPDLLFDSPYIDWSQPFNKSSSTPTQGAPFRNQSFVEQRVSIQAHDWQMNQLDTWFPAFPKNFGAGKGSPWLQVRLSIPSSQLTLHYYTFSTSLFDVRPLSPITTDPIFLPLSSTSIAALSSVPSGTIRSRHVSTNSD